MWTATLVGLTPTHAAAQAACSTPFRRLHTALPSSLASVPSIDLLSITTLPSVLSISTLPSVPSVHHLSISPLSSPLTTCPSAHCSLSYPFTTCPSAHCPLSCPFTTCPSAHCPLSCPFTTCPSAPGGPAPKVPGWVTSFGGGCCRGVGLVQQAGP